MYVKRESKTDNGTDKQDVLKVTEKEKVRLGGGTCIQQEDRQDVMVDSTKKPWG